MSTTHEILIAARALIDTPKKWVKSAYHREKNGLHSYCAAGALISVEAPGRTAYDCLAEAIGYRCVSDWNDAPERTHAEVLAAFDKAIAATAPRQPEEA